MYLWPNLTLTTPCDKCTANMWTSFIIITHKYRIYQSADSCVAKYVVDISQPCKAWIQAHSVKGKTSPGSTGFLVMPLTICIFSRNGTVIICGIACYAWGQKTSLVMLGLCKSEQNLTLYTGILEKKEVMHLTEHLCYAVIIWSCISLINDCVKQKNSNKHHFKIHLLFTVLAL